MKLVSSGFLLAILVLASYSCKRAPGNITEEEALAAIHRFDSGWLHKNKQQVDAVLAPAYIYFTQSGTLFSRDSVVQTAGSASYVLDRMERSSFEVKLYENTAVVSTRWKGKGVYRGMPFDEDQRCSITVVKTSDKVEILSEHCTPVRMAVKFH